MKNIVTLTYKYAVTVDLVLGYAGKDLLVVSDKQCKRVHNIISYSNFCLS